MDCSCSKNSNVGLNHSPRAPGERIQFGVWNKNIKPNSKTYKQSNEEMVPWYAADSWGGSFKLKGSLVCGRFLAQSRVCGSRGRSPSVGDSCFCATTRILLWGSDSRCSAALLMSIDSNMQAFVLHGLLFGCWAISLDVESDPAACVLIWPYARPSEISLYGGCDFCNDYRQQHMGAILMMLKYPWIIDDRTLPRSSTHVPEMAIQHSPKERLNTHLNFFRCDGRRRDNLNP